ncbi:exodeoxyribonuclease V subunit gamma [Corticibacter populi]|uniref:RecBCD enzyme subunit RecC n=1 Tax=Corticibacter populi TaxID=1550736 RepID=A0A3M6QW00_9BURK|nr:exodeoxyribonuclease V subunit gamma [Corticibacter populi]RMX06692.1 exodeoxyribonuclease V subunit gamma [Corticibacter populi]RZS31727.1 DNA helicase/exodeoxyribonuclease V gamma subunit [Corticibacter populi]
MTTPASIAPGILALHGNRTEMLADTLAEWMAARPLEPLEQEVVLVQSNGMAEWLKMRLARHLGVSAAIEVDLPSRFAWRMYRHILGNQQVPYQTPLDKPAMLWHLMKILPALLAAGAGKGCGEGASASPIWQPLQRMLEMARREGSAARPASNDTSALYHLAQRIADLFDQYQVYRPDWLQDWKQERDQLAAVNTPPTPIDDDAAWQPALWRQLLQTQDAALAQAIRPRLHQRAVRALRDASRPLPAPLPRRVMLFGMTHVPLPVIELLSAMGAHSQVLLAIPNPCRFYWSDALSERELFQHSQRQLDLQARRHPLRGAIDLSAIALDAMHAHAHPLLMMWGRQVRDFIRQLEAYDEAQTAQARMGLPRIDVFDDEPDAAANGAAPLLQQVQHHVRDLLPLAEHPHEAIAVDDRSICFQVAHSPVREVEALHDHLLDLLRPEARQTGLARLQPRDIIVMVPDIAQYAPLIRAVFGQYASEDPRHLPFDIADLAPQTLSPLLQALEWLVRLPEQRAGLSELSDLLAVPAIAQRFGLDADAIAQLQHWMQGSGIRWGLDASHRQQLGVAGTGAQNTAWFGLQRMLLAYASGQGFAGTEPYTEVGGLAAAHVGALAQLLGLLQHWERLLASAATPAQWGARWRALLADFFLPADETDRSALALADQALQDWLSAVDATGFADPLPLTVARHAWLGAMRQPDDRQRFHAGGITFCTLLPMRAIPFEVVCLLGMNDGAYPRRSTPSEMDLMRQPGQRRPGDRSRAQDDRQLMLEALLSARRQLLISWVGRSVRDNTVRPPSVLVAQLQDYLRAGWAGDVVSARTTEHPLQPFSPRYFESVDGGQGQSLATWAHEWLPVPITAAAPGLTDTMPLPAPAASGEAPPAWTLAELARFWRNPAQAWFETRLQTRYPELPEVANDCEPIGIDGLARWQIFQQVLQTVQPLIAQHQSWESVSAEARQQLQRHAMAGQLPIGTLGERLQQQWLEQLQFLLREWLHSEAQWPHVQQRLHLQLQHPREDIPGIDDWIGGLRGTGANVDHMATDPAGASWLHLSVKPTRLIRTPGNSRRPPVLRLDKLIDAWLCALALASRQPAPSTTAGTFIGPAVSSRIIGLDAVLDITPVPATQARQWLEQVLETAHLHRQQPLPFGIDTALAWYQALTPSTGAPTAPADAAKALQAANTAYQGGRLGGERDRNPYLARLWSDFASLHASGAFEATARMMLEPLGAWLQAHVRLRLPDGEPQTAEPPG